MSKFVIILLIYFYDGRIDETNTSFFFPTALECARFKASTEFTDLLKNTFKDKGIQYIKSQCRVRKNPTGDIIANNGSNGICQISSCIWK
jgi:hypothetical protein